MEKGKKKELSLLNKLEENVLKGDEAGLSRVVRDLEDIKIDGLFNGTDEKTNELKLRLKEVSETLKSFIGEAPHNNIRNKRINKFFSEFEKLQESSLLSVISDEAELIKKDLDRYYLKGDIEILQEIKYDLLEEMYLSSSRIHGGVIGTLALDNYTEQEKSKDINISFSTYRAQQSYLRSLITYIDNYRFIAVMTPSSKPTTQIQAQPITIENVAKDKKALQQIFEILIDANLIDKDTKIFIDKKTGGKVFLCAILIYLHGKGYYRSNPSNEEYLNICINSFGVKISLGTIKGKANFPMTDVIKLNIPAFSAT